MQWNVIDVMPCLGCVGVPAGASFPLKYKAMHAEYDCSPLLHVAEFSNYYLQINPKFQNLPTHWSLLEMHETKCVGVMRQETELLSMCN